MERKRLSISTCFDYSIPIEKQIPLIADAGFTHISLGQNQSHCNYLLETERYKLKELLSEYSLKIDTIHGPNTDKPHIIKELASIAESSAELEVPVVVLHGGPFAFDESELDLRFLELKKVCREIEIISQNTGIAFALENVLPGPATELVMRTLLEVNSQYIGFCYDSSHDQIGGPKPFDLLYKLKDRLVAVHLSDRVKEFVDHVIPWEGFIEWERLCSILKNLDMAFPLLLEVMTTHSSEKEPVKFLRLAFERGCMLHDKIFS